ncbi:hypothetical protein IT575_05245 [bacterium]|nr:hypothetical protein [bacterium]
MEKMLKRPACGRTDSGTAKYRHALLLAGLLALTLLLPPGGRPLAEEAGDSVTVNITEGAESTAVTINGQPQPPALKPEAGGGGGGGGQVSSVLNQVYDAGVAVGLEDFKSFISEHVRLYYFADVAALMKLLNPRADLVDEASTLRALMQATGSSKDAGKKVDSAVAASDSAAALLLQARQTLASRKATLDSKKIEQSNAVAEQTAASGALAALASEAPAADRTAAQQRVDTAGSTVGSANTAVDSAQKEVDSAQAEVDKKETALSEANDKLEAARSDMLLALELETNAFAARRDQQPFWVGPLAVASHDPLQRTFIYGYPDSQTLLVRGRRDDVKSVLQVIAELDQPAPQTRLTLWTMELNMLSPQERTSKKFRKYSEQLNGALNQMEVEFRDCREQLAASLSILRDVLGEEVHEWTAGDICLTMQDKYGEDQQIWTAGLPSYYAQRRFVIYEPDALFRLGFIDNRHDNYEPYPFGKDQWWESYYYTRYVVPDPANTTTLGEALMVLCLARDDFRKEVMDEYESRLNGYLEQRCKKGDFKPYHFWRLRRALALDLDGRTKSGLNGMQLAVINGLQREALDKFLPLGRSIFEQCGVAATDLVSDIGFEQEFPLLVEKKMKPQLWAGKDLKKILEQTPPDRQRATVLTLLEPLACWNPQKQEAIPNWQKIEYDDVQVYTSLRRLIEYSGVTENSVAFETNQQRDYMRLLGLAQNYVNLFDWVYSEFGVSPQVVEDKVERIHDFKESFFAPHETEPDIAKADQLLKQLNIAMEDDLDEMFVQPMLGRLRTQLVADRINVGIVQRTSMLATNRLAAQIIPRSSAELALGREEDVLAAAQQFNQLLPLLGDTSLLKAAEREKLLGALEGLQQDSEDENLQVYGITSGNRFKVTPIFDASGQAQRFRFDYVYGNIIKDPDNSSGGSNPRLPRTESIAIDTEVQVDNFEIREISRFENNVKLGLAERRSGGIPILRDMECFEDVPLIGWFKKRGGESAVVQHTIIFAQSTMYPTIGDIMDVLTQPLPDVEYLYEPESRLEAGIPKTAPEPYHWKGLVLYEKSAAELKLDKERAKSKLPPLPCRPAVGVQAVVIEENAPGSQMQTYSALTSAEGSFDVEFNWNARFRYRLVILHPGQARPSDGSGFKHIPEFKPSEEEKKAGKKPTFDSSKVPILIAAPISCAACSGVPWPKPCPDCGSAPCKPAASAKIWKGQAVLASGCVAAAKDTAGLQPAIQVEKPPANCPEYIKGSFNADGSFSIDFNWDPQLRYRLVLLGADNKCARISEFGHILAGQEPFNLVSLPQNLT